MSDLEQNDSQAGLENGTATEDKKPVADAKPKKADATRKRRAPTHEEAHRDIALGNSYRIELSKLLLALAAGLFAFSVAFQPATFPNVDISNLELGWYALALSMAGGMGNLYGWEKFYLSYRDFDLKEKFAAGKKYRGRVTFWRRIARFLQFFGFLVGATLIGYFTSENIKARPDQVQACTVPLNDGECPDGN